MPAVLTRRTGVSDADSRLADDFQCVYDARMVRHMKFKEYPLFTVILANWGITSIQYCFQVSANRIGHRQFTAAQLKTIQVRIGERENVMTQDVYQICKEEIIKLLVDHAESPLKNMREEDFRATLLAMLRSRFEGMAPATIEAVSGSPAERLLQGKKPIEDKTSRVHAEVKLVDKKDRFDLVVLRGTQVRFKVKRGMTDVQASMCLEDIAAVIEVKAAPLSHPSTPTGIRTDLEKLSKLSSDNSQVLRFLVVIEKSLSLGLVDDVEDSGHVRELENLLTKEARLRHKNTVEVWYLAGRKLPPRQFIFGQTRRASAA